METREQQLVSWRALSVRPSAQQMNGTFRTKHCWPGVSLCVCETHTNTHTEHVFKCGCTGGLWYLTVVGMWYLFFLGCWAVSCMCVYVRACVCACVHVCVRRTHEDLLNVTVRQTQTVNFKIETTVRRPRATHLANTHTHTQHYL